MIIRHKNEINLCIFLVRIVLTIQKLYATLISTYQCYIRRVQGHEKTLFLSFSGVRERLHKLIWKALLAIIDKYGILISRSLHHSNGCEGISGHKEDIMMSKFKDVGHQSEFSPFPKMLRDNS